MIRYALLAVAVIIIYSCGSFEGKPPTYEDLSGKEWLLTKMGSYSINKDIATTLKFAYEDQVIGNAGCNDYEGYFRIGEDGSLSISDVSSTRKMCGQHVMDQEDNYLLTLEGATSVKLHGDNLVIMSDELFQRLKFTLQKK